ncbi:unnamed protein product [Orchesella dallaii]|uniref:Ganglioside-induced differentiation-associated protein 1 n=1 Tax=Orchesella dallaii TaxID=48710 RepID=A0ABP1PLC6_9HEXA
MPEKNEVDLVLYYYPYSFYSQKVVMALHQMQIKFKTKVVDIHKGKQFAESFLSLNPKGEVPVLVDDVRVIPDSEKIIDYLEDNFANGNPGLLPTDRELRTRCEQLHQTIHGLKIEALSFGAALYDDLGIHPKPPYNCMTNRSQMKEYLDRRPEILHAAASNPLYSDALNKKRGEVYEESKLWQDRDNYEGLLIHFEKVMDECEAELASHDNQSWWLCAPELCLADIDFAFLLYRLWQLGFERRMWERNRPNVKRYFARVQLLESFQQAVSMTEGFPMMDFFTSPVFLGILGTTVILAGGYYLWSKKDSVGSALSSFFGDDNQNHQQRGAFNSRPSRMASYAPNSGYVKARSIPAPKASQFM